MFKKLACVGLIGFIFPAMGGCPCCGTANCCEQGELSSKAVMQNWLDQAEHKSSTESTSSLAAVPVTTP